MNAVFFGLIAIALLSGLLYSLVKNLRSRQPLQLQESEETIGAVYNDRLQQLESQFENGELDKENYDRARQELERALAYEMQLSPRTAATTGRSERIIAALLIIGIPALAVSLYWLLGQPGELNVKPNQTVSQLSITEMVSGLEQKLKADPDNVEGWRMLGRSYAVLENYPAAREAYAQAYKRAPDNPELALDYAEALAFMEGNNLTGQPAGLIEHALTLDPANIRGLLMQGIVFYQQGRTDAAIELWESILAKHELNEQIRSVIQSMIAQSQGTAEANDKGAQAGPPPQPATDALVRVEVGIAPELQSKVNPNDTVFIFAQAATGPKMPLAVARHRAGELPLQIILDNNSAMTESMRLSEFEEVIIVARISKSGNAGAASGDLQGTSAVINPHKRPSLKLVINTQLP